MNVYKIYQKPSSSSGLLFKISDNRSIAFINEIFERIQICNCRHSAKSIEYFSIFVAADIKLDVLEKKSSQIDYNLTKGSFSFWI